MNSLNIVKEIVSNTTLRENMSLQMQLGLPYLEKKNNRLCMSFKPHMEKYVDGNIEYYAPQYDLELVYPFKKIIRFINLSYEITVDISAPVAKVDAKELSSVGAGYVNELYDACTRVLEFQEQDGKVSDVSIKKYQKSYYDTVKKLGLTALYGSSEE
jgi:hypothetical protein